MNSKRIDISHKTIFFIAGFIAALWAIYMIIEVIVLLFIAIILMSGLSPIVNYLERFKFPKPLSIGLSYIIIVGTIGFLLFLALNPVISQTQSLLQVLPASISQLMPPGVADPAILQNELGNLSSNLVSYLLTIFNNVLAIISVLVLTFYLLLERDKLDAFIAQFFIGQELRVQRLTERIQDKLGAWLRGQITLSFIIGTIVYIVLLVLGVPFALPLAILAGLLEVVPTIGPIISAIPAVLAGFLVSPFIALLVGISFFVIQQLENSLIVPQVMRRAVGLNPLVVILAVAIGGKFLGIAGALLAVPIVVVAEIITQDILKGGDINELEVRD